jgi:hypothetical protein
LSSFAFSGDADATNGPDSSNTQPGGAGVGGVIGDIAGKIWNLPNSALGLVVAGFDTIATFITTGDLPQFDFRYNALTISNMQIGPSGGITFGNVQLYTGTNPDGTPVNPTSTIYQSPYTSFSGYQLGNHEEAHTYQSQLLGPFFFPAYFLKGGISASNSLETQADYYAVTGNNPFP